MENRILLAGQKFNKLTVIKLDHIEDKSYKCSSLKSGKRTLHLEYYLCKCECGKETIVEKSHLRKKVDATESCGCIQGTHHLSHKSRIYGIWIGMRSRCFGNNPKNGNYKNYKARGITMCEDWKNDFMSFYNWAINNGYRDDLTIERIDNNKNYCPENCKWETKSVQAQNRRCVYKLLYNGKKMLISEIAKITGIKHATLLKRFHKYGLCEKVFDRKSIKTGELL